MPSATPIYNFPYPCPDETIGPAAFANLANAIDSKLNELAADESAALNRPNARRNSVVNVATNSVLSVTTGVGSSFIIPAAGVWLVSAFIPALGGGGIANEIRLRVRQNGTVRYGVTKNLTTFIAAANASCFGPLVCAAGDTIDTDMFYTGTLTVTYTVNMGLKMIVRIA
jgi:hypothetical protein